MSAFYFARMASDIPIDLLLPTVFINLVYWMGKTLGQQQLLISCISSVVTSISQPCTEACLDARACPATLPIWCSTHA